MSKEIVPGTYPCLPREMQRTIKAELVTQDLMQPCDLSLIHHLRRRIMKVGGYAREIEQANKLVFPEFLPKHLHHAGNGIRPDPVGLRDGSQPDFGNRH